MKQKILKLDSVQVKCILLSDGRTKVEVKKSYLNESANWSFWIPDHIDITNLKAATEIIQSRLLHDFAIQAYHLTFVLG
jgi:hypothetical protein